MLGEVIETSMEGSTRRFEEGEDGQCINGARGDHEWHQVSHASRRDVQEEGGTVEGDEAPTRWATRRGRAAAVAASAAALCAVCLLVAPLYFEGRAPEGPMELSGVGMMRKLYQEDPGLVEAWAASSGKKQGAMMLAAVTGQGQKSVRHFQVRRMWMKDVTRPPASILRPNTMPGTRIPLGSAKIHGVDPGPNLATLALRCRHPLLLLSLLSPLSLL